MGVSNLRGIADGALHGDRNVLRQFSGENLCEVSQQNERTLEAQQIHNKVFNTGLNYPRKNLA